MDSVHFGYLIFFDCCFYFISQGLLINIFASLSAVLHSDPSGPYLARHVGHLSGLPVDVPALSINR